MGLDSYACGNYPTPFVGVFSDSFEETFIFFIQYFPNTIFATSFSDNQFKVRQMIPISKQIINNKQKRAAQRVARFLRL